MPFLFDFYLNGSRLKNIESGFNDSRKWEEALDETMFSLPFYHSKEPLPMYGLLEIYIREIEKYQSLNVIDSETITRLIISDKVSATSQYGIWRHDIICSEYTTKLDTKIMASLAKTRSIESLLPARFEITTNGYNINRSSITGGVYYANVWLAPFSAKQTYFINKEYIFERVARATQLIGDALDANDKFFRFDNRTAYIRFKNEDTNTVTSWKAISQGNISYIFTSKGNWSIEYGFEAIGCKNYQLNQIIDGIYAIQKFYFRVIDEFQVTVGDIIESVRQNVSVAGGIESKLWFDTTRMFELDSSEVDELYSIPVPQTYLEQATARQNLIFAFSYINAIPRLKYNSDGLDTLEVERFNLNTGTFEQKNLSEISGHQNTNQIGTRGYSILKQVLPNNTDEPTIYAPSQDDYLQVRASNLELTDSTFEIKLPKTIYTPKDFNVYIPSVTIFGNSSIGKDSNYSLYNLDVSLMPRLINIEEWKLKEVTDNFPSITTRDFWDNELGLRKNMVENLYWELGSKKIQISDVYGEKVNRTLIQNVIKLGVFEYFMINMFQPITFTYEEDDAIYFEHILEINLPFLDDATLYRDLRFRFSYLSLENLVIKNDKEDLTQIDFYSEMRQNQDESIINIVRSSRKKHGNLQRTGNKTYSFTKIHQSLSEQYEIGKKDINNFTITMINREFHPFEFLATYFITKDHNRESRQTVVDQTYRWRDNYAKTVLDRNENYSDYLIIYSPNETVSSQTTKITSNTNTIKTIMQFLLGETITNFKTRATSALVRTDGMFEVEPEITGYYYGIAAPVSAYPLVKGFSFTFGFESNLIAGDGLIQDGTNPDKYYNQAVRYTNTEGRFSEIGFIIFDNIELDSNDYETYPKVTRTSLSNLLNVGKSYFDCRILTSNGTGRDSLYVDKDPLTNFNLTYQLNVLSNTKGLYILGQAFFTENYIVNNPNEGDVKKAYLYLYKNGTEYGTFEDLKVKTGWYLKTLLTTSNISYNGSDTVSFVGIELSGVTSWAIASEDDELYIACNQGVNGFKIAKQHIRDGVKEIGNKEIVKV